MLNCEARLSRDFRFAGSMVRGGFAATARSAVTRRAHRRDRCACGCRGRPRACSNEAPLGVLRDTAKGSHGRCPCDGWAFEIPPSNFFGAAGFSRWLFKRRRCLYNTPCIGKL